MVVRDTQRMTVDEYEAFTAQPENADRHFELINGELVEDMPTPEHGLIVQALLLFIGMYLLKNPIGRVFPEVRYRIPGDLDAATIPDVSYIAHPRTYDLKDVVPFMPDLAVEVQSPGQSKQVLSRKAHYYLAHGCKLVWLIYPDEQIVEVLAEDDRQLLTIDKTLTGSSAVLPGFTLPVRDIFPVIETPTA